MELRFRNIEPQDFWVLYGWRHNSDTVKWSFSPPPTLEQHKSFFDKILGNKNFFMGEIRSEPVVTANVREGEIGITVNPLHRREGIGKKTIIFLQDNYNNLFAKVKEDNEASLRMFTSCGFKTVKHQDAVIDLEWRRNDA